MNTWVAKVKAERAERGEVVEQAEERQIARRESELTEEALVRSLMENAADATDLQTRLLQETGKMLDEGKVRPDNVATVMRGVTDAQAKTVDTFMKLTGRAPTSGESDTVALMRGLARDGLLKIHVDLEVGGGHNEGDA